MTRSAEVAMKDILSYPLAPEQAALWFLGQAGYVLRGSDVTLAIDPYLSDSAAAVAPELARAVPVPFEPEALRVDLYVVTHDHLDHLDPDTVTRYPHKATTTFVAPRLACRKLAELGVPPENIVKVDAGGRATVRGVRFDGVWAVPTGPDVPDTCGYRLELPSGRSVYHSSDTAWSDLLPQNAPRAEVLLVCINGKWGNLDAEQAARLTASVRPRFAVPNHYDMMTVNSADPQAFARAARTLALDAEAQVLKIMDPFVWGPEE